MGRLGFIGLIGAFVTVAAIFALASLVLDTVKTRIAGVLLAAVQNGVVVRNLALAGKVMGVVAVATLFHKAPDFVYKAF
jgi:hypothetical protein